MRTGQLWSLVAAMLAAGCAQGAVVNGSFEEAADGRPEGWKQQTWAGKADFEFVAGGHSGARAASVSSSEGADAAWSQTMRVKPFTRYRLSGWIRTEGLEAGTGVGACLNLSGTMIRTPAVTGTQDWTQVEVEFDNMEESGEVNCLFGGWGQSTGRAWFDDVLLEDLGAYVPASETIEARVSLNGEKTGPPINKYIYGQFIEHLGRCIYGGIWAEMLEDRKFYYPITAEYDPYVDSGGVSKDSEYAVVGRSPWEIVGDASKVTMVKEDSFVGEHTPLLEEGVSIRQRDLGVVEGKEYVGYIWLRPEGESATVQVTLAEGDATAFQVLHSGYERLEFNAKARATTDEATLTITVTQGAAYVGTVSLMPADNVKGMRADTLALLKQLDSPIYRWPGGNFVSGYNWRDGIGDRDRRPPRTNPAWTGVEHNDFGMDEFMAFCREVGAEPMVAVNTGFGDAHSAAAWVEYANGAAETYWGGKRAANGNAEGFGIKWWCVGNEMFGPWQLGFMQLAHYTLKHNQVAQAMWSVDPTLKLVGVGELGRVNRRHDPDEKRGWSEGMLEDCAEHMNALSEHFYVYSTQGDPAKHAAQMVNAIRGKASGMRELHKRLESLQGRTVPISMDEWNYWYSDYVYGELGCVYRHRDALGVAAGLHEYFRNSDIIQMANYAQTVNVIGCIKTTRTQAFFSTTALPLMLYRHHYGEIPIEVVHEAAPLDVVAAWTADRKAVTVGVVNPTWDTYRVSFSWSGVRPATRARGWMITAESPLEFNTAAAPANVAITEADLVDLTGTVEVGPLTNALYQAPVE